MSKENSFQQSREFDMTAEETVQEVSYIEPPAYQYKKYGNMKVILDSPHLVLTLGPDYCFFIPAFTFFVVVAYFMISYVYSSSDNFVFRCITVSICTIQPITYLITALTDPGVITETAPDDPNQTKQARKMRLKECNRCGIEVPRFTYHCEDCEVCIQGYDHHCPWVSKCIGRKNLIPFYIFLPATSVFMIYCMVAFFICASLNLQT